MDIFLKHNQRQCLIVIVLANDGNNNNNDNNICTQKVFTSEANLTDTLAITKGVLMQV